MGRSLKLLLLGALLGAPALAFAVNVSVPQSTGYGQILIGNASGGGYSTAATSSTNFFTLTTTGSSGAATYSGGTLNIPQYSGGSTFPFTPTSGWDSLTANSTSSLLVLTNGIAAIASSTIGNGAQAGGLTISGGATTTGNAYFGGMNGFGLSAPSGLIDADVGTTTTNNVNVTNICSPYFTFGQYRNYALQTEDFSNATWVKNNENTVTANTATDAAGGALAEQISGTASDAYVKETVATGGITGTWTFSVWIKAQNASGTASSSLRVDFGTGSATTTNASVSYQVVSGYRRYDIQVTNNSASNTFADIYIYNGADIIAAWGAQFEPTTMPNCYSGARTTTQLTTLTATALIRAALTTTGSITTASTVSGLTGAFTGSISITTTAATTPLTVSNSSLATGTLLTSDGLLLTNVQAATAGLPNQESPRVRFHGLVFNPVSTPVDAFIQLIPNAPTSGPGTTSVQLKYAYNGLSTSTPFTATANNVGISSTSPFAVLSVHALSNNQYPTNILFAIGSSTASATTTLFSISNIGSTTMGSFGQCSGSSALTTDSSGTIVCGLITASAASTTLLADSNTFSGNDTFSNTITGSISGNAGTATKLQTARNINSVLFDGSADITITAASSTLLANQNTFSAANMFLASTTIGNGSVTGGLTVSGTATTSNLINLNITSALALFDANHKETAYGGASACSSNNFVTTISAVGATTCGTASITINGSSVSLGGSITVASTTLLSDTNTWSALNSFSSSLTGSSTIGKLVATSSASVASSTGAQLLFDDGLFGNRVQFRNLNGSLYVGTSTYSNLATSTFSSLVLTKDGQLYTGEYTPATSTAMTVDWLNTPNQVLLQIGTAAVTIGFNNASTTGMTKRIVICNGGAAASTVTWSVTSLLWSGGIAPTQTTTANKCDIYSFITSQASSTSKTTVTIFGGPSQNF